MQYKFDELLDFPCVIDFRIIIDAQYDNALDKLIAFINSQYENSVMKLLTPPRKSTNGKYLSYTIPVKVLEASHIEDLYKKISALEYVKHII